MSRESRRRKRALRRRRPSSPWPDGHRADLVRAALLDGEPAVAAWRAWRGAADLDRLDQASFRLLPLVWRNLDRLGVLDPFMPTLRGIHRRAWAENQVLLRRLSVVLTALAGEGIPTMLLKGAALVSEAYADAGARPMADADVWVGAARFHEAVAVLAAAGWRPNPAASAADPGGFRKAEHAIGLRAATDAHDALDLHHDLFRVYGRYEVPVPEARFWDASEPCAVGGVPARRLAPHHLLLHVVFHGLQWQRIASIRWVADADRLIRARAHDFNWDALLADARDLRFVDTLRDALVHLSDAYGTPVPASVLASLRSARVSVVERLERPLLRRESSIAARVCASLRRHGVRHERRSPRM